MVPVQRQTRTQGRKRRSHDGLRAGQWVNCPNCGGPKTPHSACNNCGYVRPGLKLNLNNNKDS
ncbi:50S ribosomal protein L32 [Mucisphaera calidilacus]|uniref:Large ribosomal subunit protein bL32 n=1 Tax=Mucisphaera calidilacus TaxID=2527982 RepID=A0A518BVZ8_9BACT|nr:50S ribosomal protein L32 [Mucisphaera calidilacus]